jgi:uncharacterized protein YndB with AHSA1/START domain
MNAMLNPAMVVVRRVIAAPAGEVFDAWLDPEALAIWMRPGTIRRTTATVEARVGGRYKIVMEADDRSIPHTGEYRVIDRPRRLAFTWHSPHTGGRHTLVTVDFLPIEQHTEVVITHEQLPEGEYEGHRKGWSSALDNLFAMHERAAPR